MRVETPGLVRTGGAVTIRYNKAPVRCQLGDTVGAALVAVGELVCRVDESGSERGLYCGMGTCRDCTVTINGVHGQRSCMTYVAEGMEVVSDLPRPVLVGDLTPQVGQSTLGAELLVIGGGPGGLAAATAAAEAGVDVVLVDERRKLGGQYFKQPSDAFLVEEAALDRQYRRGRDAIRRARQAGVQILTGVQIWGLNGPRELFGRGYDAEYVFRPRRLVIATGAYERAVPLPGWTLPGFMTAGAGQTLMRSQQVLPGRRVLVAGNGPLNLQVASELSSAGAEVVAVCEIAPIFNVRRAKALLAMLTSAPDLVADGSKYLVKLRRKHVPLLVGCSIVSVEGTARVEKATVASIDSTGMKMAGSERVFVVDAICAGFGFMPSNELARALGVKHRYSEEYGQLITERSTTGRTDVDGIWVVGDAGGIGGATLASAVGFIAGLDVVSSLHRTLPAQLLREGRASDAARRRAERFERGLFRLYGAPLLTTQLANPSTAVCRCEGVTLRAVKQAIAQGALTMGAVKRMTRAGMGRCQGRYCSSALASMCITASQNDADPFDWFAPAPPLRPLTVAAMAESEPT